MNLLLAFIAFNIIVIVHETGHFIAARKSGIKVLEFSLFIGPKILSFKKNDTEYSLRLFPLLAYVKMEGEEEESDSETSFNNRPRHARAFTAISGPLANLLLAIVLLTTVFAIQGYVSRTVGRVEEKSPAETAGLKPGDKIVSYSGKKVYLPLDMIQFLYVSKGVPAEIEYSRDGHLFSGTLIPRIIPETISPKLGVSLGFEYEEDSNVIKALSPGLPAEKMGLQPGDRIVKLNGMDVDNSRELIDFVSQNGLNPIDITIVRGASEVNLTITPVEVKSQEMYDIGLEFTAEKGGILDSLRESAAFTYSIVRSTCYSIGWLISGKAKLSDMTGPIGMVSAIGTAVEQAPNTAEMLLNLLYYTALFSIALGATNLLPFPVLDGGRLMLVGLEAIRRKPMSRKNEAYISAVGFILIILLGIYAAYNDIVRILKG